jgi:hypothetical protein
MITLYYVRQVGLRVRAAVFVFLNKVNVLKKRKSTPRVEGAKDALPPNAGRSESLTQYKTKTIYTVSWNPITRKFTLLDEKTIPV